MAQTTRRPDNTRQIPRSEWQEYLERFTQQQLMRDPPEAVTIEVLSPTAGDQYEAQTERFLGLAYDPKRERLEVLLETMDHLVFHPVEIWAIETDGFINALELVRADGAKEILYIYRSGPPAPLQQPPAPSAA
jgi:hypothetical protein